MLSCEHYNIIHLFTIFLLFTTFFWHNYYRHSSSKMYWRHVNTSSEAVALYADFRTHKIIGMLCYFFDNFPQSFAYHSFWVFHDLYIMIILHEIIQMIKNMDKCRCIIIFNFLDHYDTIFLYIYNFLLYHIFYVLMLVFSIINTSDLYSKIFRY